MVKMLTKIVSIITNSKSFFLINNYSKQERIMLNVTVPSILEFIYIFYLRDPIMLVELY